MGFRVDCVQWNVIGGVAVGDSVGCSSILSEGLSQPYQRWPQAAAGRSAILVMQEKEISRSRMTPRSWAATSLSLPSLIPWMECPASIPPCQGSSQWAGCRRRLDCGSCAGEPRAQKPFCL